MAFPPLTVLVQTQGTTRMLHKQIQQPDFVVADLGKSSYDLVCDEVGAAGLGGQGKLFLEPGHWAGGGVSFGG